VSVTDLEEPETEPVEYDPEHDPRDVVYDVDDEFPEDEFEELDEESATFVHNLVLRILVFVEEFTGRTLYPYQKDMAYRLVESVILNDGEEITVIAARQSGKSECMAAVLAGLMVILPKLSKVYPTYCGQFSEGFWIGCFGPVEDQGATIWGRIVSFLTSERATEYMLEPSLEDRVDKGKRGEKAATVYLKISRSLCRLQSCNPKAKIESKTYHFIVIDEAQEADGYTIGKSIKPMLASTAGTLVLTGTATRTKGYFYKAIQYNKRRYVNSRNRKVRRNHLEWDYKLAAKYNHRYAKYIKKEKVRLTEDSEEFQMAYLNRWMLDRGMLITENRFDQLCDPQMPIVRQWYQTPVVVGIDPARTKDSTVVTVVWVDWQHPDPFGFYEHRVLNWLEITNEEWESQYFEIVDFLSNYRVYRVGVDAQGVGGAVAERLALLLPQAEVLALPSNNTHQNERWVHLTHMMQRNMLVFPGHSKAKRLRIWKRFQQQMIDAEKKYVGGYLQVEAPDEKDAHDDFVDSLALACSLTKDDQMPTVEVTSNLLYR
jgi:hypothetical protein